MYVLIISPPGPFGRLHEPILSMIGAADGDGVVSIVGHAVSPGVVGLRHPAKKKQAVTMDRYRKSCFKKVSLMILSKCLRMPAKTDGKDQFCVTAVLEWN